ncbi:MAG TPA: hypothetical protein VFE46_02360 [Pirellulales bacterium]|jgi:hypothetical protein|nr:hypothetical protein [Pirellulales bacterium]
MSGSYRSALISSFVAVMIPIYAAAISLAADAPSGDTAKADAGAADLKVIKPEEAKDYEGKDVVVEFQVVNARELGTGICFLNSSSDFNDPGAFTAVISAKGLSEFKKDSKTEKPADFFKDKKVRVTGKVLVYQKDKDSAKKFEIKVDSPKQIKIVETDAHKS